MRAGLLDRQITIEAYSADSVDELGNVTEAWEPIATIRAQRVQASSEEFIRDHGEATDTVVIYRTHFFEGVTTAHRVTENDQHFNIRELKEIGRREALEIRCEELRT